MSVCVGGVCVGVCVSGFSECVLEASVSKMMWLLYRQGIYGIASRYVWKHVKSMQKASEDTPHTCK